jgi:ech hydrogenase subunit D
MTAPAQTAQQANAFELIDTSALLDRVRGLHQKGCRLVQIGATRLPEQVELTYSFDLEQHLTNLRLHIPAEQARVPSISSIYWCAFLYENEIHDLFNVQVDDMAVDFHGTLYTTAVKHPFGAYKGTSKPAAPAAPAPATVPTPATPAPASAGTTC